MDDIWAYLVAGTDLSLLNFWYLCGIAFVASFITAAFGLGGGVLALAAMATVLPPAVLIPLNGVVQLGSNFGRAVMMLKSVLKTFIPVFLIGTIIGVAIGGQVVVALPTHVLMVILGLFILYATWGPRPKATQPGKKTFFLVGLVGAFVTMFVGATGPLVAPFAAAASDKRQEVVATHAAMMTIQHGFKLIVFGLLGFAFGPYVPLMAGMLAFGFAGTFVGKHTLNVIPEKAFRIIFKVGITALALRLLYRGLID